MRTHVRVRCPGRVAWICRAMLAGGLLGFLGCELSSYEEKMDKAQRMLKQAEEENKYLDAPVTFPDVKLGGYTVLDSEYFFFRVPKGVDPAEAKPVFNLFFRCPGTGLFSEVLFSPVNSDKPDKFQTDILLALGLPGLKGSDETRGPGGKIAVKYYHEDKKNGRQIFFYLSESEQVAIVYTPAPDVTESEWAMPMDYSLGTLALGPTAKERKRRYRPARGESRNKS